MYLLNEKSINDVWLTSSDQSYDHNKWPNNISQTLDR